MAVNNLTKQAYIIGNGPSRAEFYLSELEGTTFGCNALYRDYRPDWLIGGDATIIKEICATGYPEKNWCIFPHIVLPPVLIFTGPEKSLKNH